MPLHERESYYNENIFDDEQMWVRNLWIGSEDLPSDKPSQHSSLSGSGLVGHLSQFRINKFCINLTWSGHSVNCPQWASVNLCKSRTSMIIFFHSFGTFKIFHWICFQSKKEYYWCHLYLVSEIQREKENSWSVYTN